MRTSIIGNSLIATVLAFLAIGFSLPAAADGNSLGVSRQESAPAGEAVDIKEQLRQGIAAYDRGDYDEAFRVFRNVSVLGGSEAHYRLGLMYAQGHGTPQSLNRAAYWLKLAARQNHPGATEALSALKQPGMPG
ncbi:MAG: hypothetical protein H6R10_3158 [Rhodocyclaceae bacterium]|nr:hypothetical protein [Rhodocyclaceae bacterium]